MSDKWQQSSTYSLMRNWTEQLHQKYNLDLNEWDDLKGDAGFRRYARVGGLNSKIVSYSPSDTENLDDFLNIQRRLLLAGIHVPQIFEVNKDQGFVLQEDVGRQSLFDKVQSQQQPLYHQAVEQLVKMASLDSNLLSVYHAQMVFDELDLFREWLLHKTLSLALSRGEKLMIEQAMTYVCDAFIRQPQVFVHRDYHCQNLMINDNQCLSIIDFQGAVQGPIGYDLASLLKDCYVDLGAEFQHELLTRYHTLMKPTFSMSDLQRYVDIAGLQRHLKVLGLFPRLWIRDGKPHYLQHMHRVCDYVSNVLPALPALESFQDWFESVLKPALKQQPWY